MEGSTRIRLDYDYDIFRSEYLVLLKKHTREGTFHAKITWEPVDPRGDSILAPVEPSFRVTSEDRENKPRFFEDLIKMLKSNGMIGEDVETKLLQGQLEAKKEHLEDMRKLVFKN